MKMHPFKSLTQLALAAAVSAVMCSTSTPVSAQQTIATWWVNALTNLPPPNPFTNNTANPGVIVYPMTKGSGIGEPTGTAEYGGNTWTNVGLPDSEANSIANGLYLTYAIQAAPGYTVSFSTNMLYYHVSATGPGQAELQYSTDGVNYTDILPITYAGGDGGSAVTALMTNNLSTIAVLQNVPSTTTNFFRLVNWGATSTGGTWYIYDNPPAAAGTNGFVVLGSVAPVPPAESLATWWVNALTNLPPPNPFTNNTAAANLIVGPMMKGSGIGEPTGTSEYGGNTWTNAGLVDSEANSIANGLYLTYSLQAAPGYTVSFFTNVLYYHVSGTGPSHGELQYSTDGINYSDLLAMNYAGGGGGSSATALMTNNLSTFDALQNVPSTTTNFFRIVNWGATGTSGTWYIYDNPPIGTNGFVVIGGLNSLTGVVAPTNLVVSPASLTANAGTTVSFTASQTGSPATNLWYEISGTTTNFLPWATSATLTLTNVLAANSGGYFAVLTNMSGSATSSVVTLSVIDPVLQVQPSSAQGLVDGTVQFAVTVAGTSPFTYQWYFSDLSGDLLAPVNNGVQGDASVVFGANTSLLTLTNLQTTTALNNFVVVAANAFGSVTSSVASLLSVTNTQGMLALWDFDGVQFTNTAINPNCLNNPAAFIGYGTAAAVGTCYDPGTSPFSGATDPADVAGVFSPFGFVQPSPNFSWGTENYPVTGTNKANGVQFNVSTVGAKNINVSYDSRVSATASDYDRLQFTTNGTNWIDYPASSTFSGLYGSGNAGYYTFTYSLVGFPGVENNPNFGVRIVTEYENTATYGVGTTNTWVGTANSYTSGASGNSAPGTVTYDLVAITADAITNNNVPPVLSAMANTNTVDTNTLTLNFTVLAGTTPPDQLAYNAVTLAEVAAEPTPSTISPNFVFGGSGTNRTLSISFAGNPIPDANDAGPILVTATDASGDSSASWFVLTVGSINQPPTNTLTSLQTTNLLANSGLTIPFAIGSARNTANNLTYSAVSDNNTVIPTGNLVFGGNPSTGNLTLAITPVADQVGNAKISVTVTDPDQEDGGLEPRSTTANIEVMVRPNTNVVLVDYFDYDSSGSLDVVAGGLWNHLSGINGQMQVGSGYALVDTADNTENVQAQLLGSPYKTNSAAVLYASFMVNMSPNKMPAANGSYFAIFNDGSGVTGDVEGRVVAATNGAALGNYRIGIDNFNGANGTNSVMFPQDLTPGSNYLVIVRLVVANGFSTLWINPTNQSAPSVTDSTPAPTPTNLYDIANFELRESGSSAGSVSVGQLTVGLAFDSVFYPPQANPGAYAVTENTTNLLSPLLLDAGSELSLISVGPDTNGTVTISGTNITYLPTNNFAGTDTIGYTIMDDLGNTNSSTLTVLVTNIPPVVNPVVYTVSENSPASVLNPLTNDVVKTPGGSLSLVSLNPDANGTASIVNAGQQVLFTPANNFTGVSTIGYTVTDGIGGTNSSTLTVNVVNVTPIPVSAQLAGGNLVLTWTNAAFNLQTSTNVAGPYIAVPGATSPYTNLIGTNAAGFYRLVH
jgi:hypothetical protein